MNPQAFDTIDEILATAYADGRTMLYEHEVYGLLAAAGLSVPRCAFVSDISDVSEAL